MTNTADSPEDGHLSYQHYMYLSQKSVCLIESQLKQVQKGRDQLQVTVLARCLLRESRLYRVVALDQYTFLGNCPPPLP